MAAKKKTSTKKPAAKPAAKKSSTTKTTAKKPGATKPKPVSKKSRASEQMDQSMDLPKKSRGAAKPSKKGKAGVASADEGGRKTVAR